MRSMGRLFAAALAIGVVGAMGAAADPPVRQRAVAASPTVAASQITVPAGQVKVSLPEAKAMEAVVVVPLEISNVMSAIKDVRVICEVQWANGVVQKWTPLASNPDWAVSAGGGVSSHDFKFVFMAPNASLGRKFKYTCYLTTSAPKGQVPVISALIYAVSHPDTGMYPAQIAPFLGDYLSTWLPHKHPKLPFPTVGIEGEMEFAAEIRTSPMKWNGLLKQDLSVMQIPNKSIVNVQAAPSIISNSYAQKAAYDASRFIVNATHVKALNLLYSIPIFELKARALASFNASTENMKLADAAAKVEDWPAANHYLVVANDFALAAFKVGTAAKKLEPAVTALQDLLIKKQWYWKEQQAQLDLADKALKAAMNAIGADESPSVSQTFAAQEAIDAAPLNYK